MNTIVTGRQQSKERPAERQDVLLVKFNYFLALVLFLALVVFLAVFLAAFFSTLAAARSLEPALKVGCLEAATLMASPVRGLRAVRAARSRTSNVPKPIS